MFVIAQHLDLALTLILLSFSLSPLCHALALEKSCANSNECSKYDEGADPIDNEPSVFLKSYVIGEIRK